MTLQLQPQHEQKTHVITIQGDLVQSNATFIVHQCNCVTSHPKHLSQTMFRAFPYADIYSGRKTTGRKGVPGTIVIKGDGVTQRYVVNLMGQYYPGKSKYDNDSPQKREEWFMKALQTFSRHPDLKRTDVSVAFPYNIGCGAAGGEWKKYEHMIELFASVISAQVYLVKLQ